MAERHGRPSFSEPEPSAIILFEVLVKGLRLGSSHSPFRPSILLCICLASRSYRRLLISIRDNAKIVYRTCCGQWRPLSDLVVLSISYYFSV